MSLVIQSEIRQAYDSIDAEVFCSPRAKSRVLVHACSNQHQIAEGFLRIVQESLAHDEDSRNDLGYAIEAIRKAKRMTQYLSEMMECEAEKHQLTDLVSLLNELADEWHLDHVIEANRSIEGRSLRKECDLGLVREAIVALIENGCEASGSPVRVSIDSEIICVPEAFEIKDCYLEPGDYYMIEIVDQGRGMSEQVLAEAFGLFCSTKSTEHGVGVGIPLAQSAAERYGGSLHIRSELGVGTSATIYLPLD